MGTKNFVHDFFSFYCDGPLPSYILRYRSKHPFRTIFACLVVYFTMASASMRTFTALRSPSSLGFCKQKLSGLDFKCRSTGSTPSNDDAQPSSSAPTFRGFGKPPVDPTQLSTADALRHSLGGVSNAQGRVARGTNIVFGTDDSEEKWRELDSQVNEYPGQRTFKAIGVGGDDFVASMKICVASVIGRVHEECVSSRLSAKGNYVSVTVGPVWVETPDQVLEIYSRMKEDGRLKFYI